LIATGTDTVGDMDTVNQPAIFFSPNDPAGGAAGSGNAPGGTTPGDGDGGAPAGGGGEDVNDIVNKALNGRLSRVQQKLEQGLDERFQSFSAQLTTAFTEQFQGLANQMKPPENLDEMGRLKKRLEHLDAENQRLSGEAKRRDEAVRAAEAARQKTEERQVVSDSLRGAGVADHFVRPALATLVEDGRIGRDKAGKIVWMTGDEYDPYKPFAEGFKEWAESEGKIFRSAVVRPGEGGDPKNGHSRKPDDVGPAELSSWLQTHGG